jgi:antitoxin (DNA-binding transcriptional repressor) of toxin-antitoxin stability system
MTMDLVHFMIHNWITMRVNIHEAKTHLSRFLRKLKAGEALVICNHNKPVAELRLLPSPCAEKRPVGLAKGMFEVPPSFFDPLPRDILKAFEGKTR